MQGKFLANKSSFDLEITKTKWKNRKKKKQATTITPGNMEEMLSKIIFIMPKTQV